MPVNINIKFGTAHS